PGGLLGRLTKMVIEGALEGELYDHLGYGKHEPEGRSYSASVRVLCLFAGLTWLAGATRQLGLLTGGPGW
ncbi:MAG TPA: hypothetical protein VKH61_10185, partial [Streptosporangiaceae bacterium]|nr:hypothetical protein [Streptosporangiaceae bacterium]